MEIGRTLPQQSVTPEETRVRLAQVDSGHMEIGRTLPQQSVTPEETRVRLAQESTCLTDLSNRFTGKESYPLSPLKKQVRLG